jgi:hypothetical protein
MTGASSVGASSVGASPEVGWETTSLMCSGVDSLAFLESFFFFEDLDDFPIYVKYKTLTYQFNL